MREPALQRWIVLQAVVWTGLLGYSCVQLSLPLLAAAATASYLVLWSLLQPLRNLADKITASRFVLLLLLSGWSEFAGTLDLTRWCCLVLLVCADLLDGFVARRYGESEAGAVLDMETDQWVTLGLSVLALRHSGIGPWILILPALRYIYVLYLAVLRLPAHDPKPRGGDNRRARLVCALMLSAQLITLQPALPQSVRTASGILAILLLVYSFGADMLYFARARGHSPTGQP